MSLIIVEKGHQRWHSQMPDVMVRVGADIVDAPVNDSTQSNVLLPSLTFAIEEVLSEGRQAPLLRGLCNPRGRQASACRRVDVWMGIRSSEDWFDCVFENVLHQGRLSLYFHP